MGNPRARYTLEFKLEAVRMVKGGQSRGLVAQAAYADGAGSRCVAHGVVPAASRAGPDRA